MYIRVVCVLCGRALFYSVRSIYKVNVARPCSLRVLCSAAWARYRLTLTSPPSTIPALFGRAECALMVCRSTCSQNLILSLLVNERFDDEGRCVLHLSIDTPSACSAALCIRKICSGPDNPTLMRADSFGNPTLAVATQHPSM